MGAFGVDETGFIEQVGWTLARNGSEHDVYKHSSKAGIVILPRHRTVSPGVARSIAKAAGWS
jgi:predicted RNA binding protein YcfA (HicA-like mRNA interferase family)